MQQNTRKNFTDVQTQVAAIQANDEKVLKELYAVGFPNTEAFIIANSGTAEEAKDIYQEAFIAAWQNVKAGKFVPLQGASLEAYIFQVAKYKWFDYLKAAKRIPKMPVRENIIIEETYNEEEQAYIEKVQHHFKNMGEPCRQVLTLFYFMKQSMSKIAAAFSWTEATAKNNKYRCLQRLRSMVTGTGK